MMFGLTQYDSIRTVASVTAGLSLLPITQAFENLPKREEIQTPMPIPNDRDKVTPAMLLYPNSVELSSLDGTNGLKINGIAADDYSGHSVSGGGDINGDGYADLIIGAPAASPNGRWWAGESYVVFGGPKFSMPLALSSLNGTNGFQINGISPEDRSGYSLDEAGDVNGDGYGDLILGAPYASSNHDRDRGESYVIFGGKSFVTPLELSSLNGVNGLQLKGIAAGERFGYSLSGAGDVNGDGYADFVIGAPYASPKGRRHAGESYVIFGRPRFKTPLNLPSLNGINGFQINGIAADDHSGHSVSGAGDVNGDGFDDLIIGAPQSFQNGRHPAGESYVVFGGPRFETPLELSSLNGINGFTITHSIHEEWATSASVSEAGDVNKDGYSDLIIGTSGSAGLWADKTYVVFGGPNFATPLELSSLNGENGFQINKAWFKNKDACRPWLDINFVGFGHVDWAGDIAKAGDVNGDGYGDLIIGDPSASPYCGESGQSYVIFGGASFTTPLELSSLNGVNGFQINGIAELDHSGWSVSGAGDVNGDGYDDILIGAPDVSPDPDPRFVSYYRSPVQDSQIYRAGQTYIVYGGIEPPPPTGSNKEIAVAVGGVVGLLTATAFCFWHTNKVESEQARIPENELKDELNAEITTLT